MKLALLAALLCASGSPEGIPSRPEELHFAAAEVRLGSPAEHRHRLPNGAVVYVIENHSLPLVDVMVLAPLGSALDPPGKAGLATLTARLLRRGASAKHSAAELGDAFDRLAARREVVAGEVLTTASLNLLSGSLEAGLPLFFESLREPAFAEDALASEREALLTELGRRANDPAALADRGWRNLLYGAEVVSAQTPTAGSLGGIRREDLLELHRRTFAASGLVVAVAGDVSTPAVLKALEAELSRFPGGRRAPLRLPAGAAPKASPGVYFQAAGGSQDSVILGQPGWSWQGRFADADLYAWMLLHEVLVGGELSSRLVRSLRSEEGLVYYPSSDPGLALATQGTFQIRFRTRPEKVALAVEKVRAEIARLASEPPSADETEIARASLLSRLGRTFESPKDLATLFAQDEALGRPAGFWPGAPARYRQLTPADLARVAAKMLRSEELTVLISGPSPPPADLSRLGAVTLAAAP